MSNLSKIKNSTNFCDKNGNVLFVGDKLKMTKYREIPNAIGRIYDDFKTNSSEKFSVVYITEGMTWDRLYDVYRYCEKIDE